MRIMILAVLIVRGCHEKNFIRERLKQWLLSKQKYIHPLAKGGQTKRFLTTAFGLQHPWHIAHGDGVRVIGSDPFRSLSGDGLIVSRGSRLCRHKGGQGQEQKNQGGLDFYKGKSHAMTSLFSNCCIVGNERPKKP